MAAPSLTQKVCPRCRSIFMGTATEIVCPTCQEGIKRASERTAKVRRQTESPANPVLECMIQRDGGVTVVPVGGCSYTFKPNSEGRSVCSVTNPAHHTYLLKTGHYQSYQGLP